jgi:hypothetical protein
MSGPASCRMWSFRPRSRRSTVVCRSSTAWPTRTSGWPGSTASVEAKRETPVRSLHSGAPVMRFGADAGVSARGIRRVNRISSRVHASGWRASAAEAVEEPRRPKGAASTEGRHEAPVRPLPVRPLPVRPCARYEIRCGCRRVGIHHPACRPNPLTGARQRMAGIRGRGRRGAA